MIQKIQANMIRRMVVIEGSIGRFDGLEEDVTRMKIDLARALKPADPAVSNEDVERWETNCRKTTELKDMFERMQRDVEEVPRIKADITNILRIQATFVTRDNIEKLVQQIRQVET